MRSHGLAICVVLGLSVGSVCGGLVPEATQRPADAFFASGWSVGPEISWLHYEEPGLMEEDGVLYGVVFSSTNFMRASVSRDVVLRFEGGLAAGAVDYDGALLDGTPYTMDNNRDVLANLRLLYGCVWHREAHSDHVYVGAAYRFLGDDSSHDPAGYKRHSNYFYLPVGYARGQKLRDGWYFGLGGEFDLLVYGVQRSEIFGGGFEPIINPQKFGSGYGLRGRVELRHKTDRLDVSLEPFVQYWSVDDSEVDNGWYEPENNSTQVGLDVIFHF